MKQAALPVVVLMVILGLGFITTWPSGALEADHYQRFRDGKSLYAILSSRIASGDSLQHVESALGPGTPLTEEADAHRSELREQALWTPQRFPNGVQNADVFLTWPLEDQSVTLQFRNGTLVNHRGEDFEDFQPQHDVAGQRIAADTSSGGDFDLAGNVHLIEPMMLSEDAGNESR
ncbi:MAG: hypothetical protein ACYTGL_06460 [Planctomycetota bacterium]|jgi:hypothetical protein